MNSQDQPQNVTSRNLATFLLAFAVLLFAGFTFFRSITEKGAPAGSSEISLEQSKAVPSSTASNGVSDRAAVPQQLEESTKEVAASSATGTVIRVGDSAFGSMLFNGDGQAIYIWELEGSSTAECYGSCAIAWPPVLTDGAPVASAGVTSALLGTTPRSDGTTQVTYNGHPLYYYADEKPGEVKCHNVKTHGGLWWVIQPSGNRAL